MLTLSGGEHGGEAPEPELLSASRRLYLYEFGYGGVWTWTAMCADTKLAVADQV
ncbi:MAG: hypothetical protein M3R57_09170 [Chloroflexota bacterium]|nr:hypothetical protein [Chloroflexota bacterium]